jgi:hypothetical protein
MPGIGNRVGLRRRLYVISRRSAAIISLHTVDLVRITENQSADKPASVLLESHMCERKVSTKAGK